tara:strand:- start:625 stop:2109 length:1485 start_codon:yes stop_codon:yes gene_type:complete
MYTNQNDPLSQQLDSMNETFQKNPAMAQKYASIPQKTMETLTAQRVVNEFAKQNRKLQEEAFVGRTGNPNSTVDDDLKSKGVMLSKDLTSLKAQAVGDAARGQQMDQQNALNKLVSANKRSPVGGIGRLLNNPNAAPASTRGGGVPALGANNMRGMPPGGITPPAAPMRAAQGGLVSFNGEEGSFVGGEGEGEATMPSAPRTTEVSTASNRTYDLFKRLREEEKAEAKEEAARIIKSFEKEERGGFISDDAVQRMIDFGGARTLSEGFRQSSSAANQREAAERKELNDALAGIRKDGSALTATSLQAAIAAGQLDLEGNKLEENASQFDARLALDKFEFTEEQQTQLDALKEKGRQFDATLGEKVKDRELRKNIEAAKLSVDESYKTAVISLQNQENITAAKSIVVRLASEKNTYLSLMQTVMDSQSITPQEKAREITKLGADYTRRMQEIANSVELDPTNAKVVMERQTQANAAEQTKEAINKKQGGIISLMG